MLCGKHIYVNRQQAMTAINGMKNERLTGFAGGNKKNKRAKRQPGRTYFCHGCNGWHLNTEGKNAIKHPKNGSTVQLDTKRPPDKQVIGKSQQPLIIHDVLKFKVK